MIYAFEYLSEHEKNIILGYEPFIDFEYSVDKQEYKWSIHQRLKNDKKINSLRLFAFNQLKQGIICTDFEEAKYLSIYLTTNEDFINLQDSYKWLGKYVEQRKEKYWLTIIALPVCEYIKRYSNNFEKLQLIDFTELFSLIKN